ncbi:MAG: hypothetical protein NZ576_06075 [Bacteroidia bacterium]|nr:hypothetical protein [Bacteroidia bacterium]
MTFMQDNFWKYFLPLHFVQALAYFFPEIAAQLAPNAPIQFLTQELPALFPTQTQRFVDLLAQITLQNGQQHLVLVHVEIQGYQDPLFPERMFTYFYRIKDKFPHQNILSLAIFTDNNPQYHPRQYTYHFHGTTLIYQYNTFKLLDWKVEELYQAGNLFSIALQVARLALERKKQNQDEWKFQWLKELLQRLKKEKLSLEQLRSFLYLLLYAVKFDNPQYRDKMKEELKTAFLNEQEILSELIAAIEKDTFEEGVNYGKELGRKEGIEEGIELGRKEGIEEGIELGRKEGIEEGIERATLEGIRNCLALQMNEATIAQIFNVTIEYVQNIKQSMTS